MLVKGVDQRECMLGHRERLSRRAQDRREKEGRGGLQVVQGVYIWIKDTYQGMTSLPVPSQSANITGLEG